MRSDGSPALACRSNICSVRSGMAAGVVPTPRSQRDLPRRDDEARARLQAVAARAHPFVAAGDRRLPVAGLLGELLPAGGVQRGSTIAVDGSPGSGSTTVALTLAAAATAAGEWAAVVDPVDPWRHARRARRGRSGRGARTVGGRAARAARPVGCGGRGAARRDHGGRRRGTAARPARRRAPAGRARSRTRRGAGRVRRVAGGGRGARARRAERVARARRRVRACSTRAT